MQFTEKLWRILENIETLNLQQQKVKETIQYQNQTITPKGFSQKIEITINKPVYLRLSTLNLSKTVMYEFWYDYVKQKYGENAKLCYMDTESFIFHLKTEDIYIDIVEDVEERFDTSNFEMDL